MRTPAILIVSLASLCLIAANTDPHQTGKSKPGRDRPASQPTSRATVPAHPAVR